MDIASNINITTRTARPMGPPAAHIAALPAVAVAFAAAAPPLAAAAATLAEVTAVFAAFAPAAPALAPAAPALAPAAPALAPVPAARVAAATNIASRIIPPPTAIVRFLTNSTFAAFGFGGALASG